QILFNVDLEIAQGEIVALLGTNGAGKSTLLNAIAGTAVPSNGAIYFAGENITYLPAANHVANGIVTVPGGKGVFPSLTVAENLHLAAWALRQAGEDPSPELEQVHEMFP